MTVRIQRLRPTATTISLGLLSPRIVEAASHALHRSEIATPSLGTCGHPSPWRARRPPERFSNTRRHIVANTVLSLRSIRRSTKCICKFSVEICPRCTEDRKTAAHIHRIRRRVCILWFA